MKWQLKYYKLLPLVAAHVNTYDVAGECRRHVQHFTKIVKNVNILEFHYHIWNHHEKCIQTSTNMPGIGLIILEIDVEM